MRGEIRWEAVEVRQCNDTVCWALWKLVNCIPLMRSNSESTSDCRCSLIRSNYQGDRIDLSERMRQTNFQLQHWARGESGRCSGLFFFFFVLLYQHSEQTQKATPTSTGDGYAVPRSGRRWSCREAKGPRIIVIGRDVPFPRPRLHSFRPTVSAYSVPFW